MRASSNGSACAVSALRALTNIWEAYACWPDARNTRPASSKKVGRKCGTEPARRSPIDS